MYKAEVYQVVDNCEVNWWPHLLGVSNLWWSMDKMVSIDGRRLLSQKLLTRLMALIRANNRGHHVYPILFRFGGVDSIHHSE